MQNAASKRPLRKSDYKPGNLANWQENLTHCWKWLSNCVILYKLCCLAFVFVCLTVLAWCRCCSNGHWAGTDPPIKCGSGQRQKAVNWLPNCCQCKWATKSPKRNSSIQLENQLAEIILTLVYNTENSAVLQK